MARLGDIAIVMAPGHADEGAELGVELAAIGYIVTVYGDSPEPVTRRGIPHRHRATFDPLDRRLATISQAPELFDHRIGSRVRLLWVREVDLGDRLTHRRAEAIDSVLALSDWHARHVRGRHRLLRDKIALVRDGLAQGSAPSLVHRARRVVAPAPDHDALDSIWRLVRARCRDAMLELVDAGLPGSELGALLLRSLVWAQPSVVDDQPTHDPSGARARQAQAAGCLVVCSDWGALRGSVVAGRLVSAPALSPAWRDAFAAAIVDGLTSPETQAWAQRAGPEAMRALGWGATAQRVSDLIEELAGRAR